MRSHAINGGRAPAPDAATARKFFDLGMTCATGAGDLVSAHKWFNLAAMHGDQQASARRVEIVESHNDVAQGTNRSLGGSIPQGIERGGMP